MRWIATVNYRIEDGILQEEYRFEELHDLHDIIERGPNWNCIVDIVIMLARPATPNLTLEAAERL